MSNTRKPIEKWQYERPSWDDIQNKPTTWEGLGLSGTFPFVSLSAQSLTEGQKNQVKTNLGITSSTPVSLGANTNGLELSGQVLQLGLATTSLSGAMSAADKVRVDGANIVQGSGIALTGTLTSRILGTGNVTFAVDATVLRVSGAQVITGLKDTRIAGPNDGSTFATVKRYSIDSGNLYGLELRNTLNTRQASGQAGWHYAFIYNAAEGTPKTREMLGFSYGAVTVIGDKDLSTALFTQIASDEATNIANPSWRYPIVQYTAGTHQVSGGLIVGTDQVRTSKIDADTKLYVEGGIRTLAADGVNEETVLFGEYETSANTTVDTIWKVKVGDKLLEIKARDITPI